ncbi:unnamed protein product [Soboliphyme baturini]|uniref:Src substrate cortactin n=1 Tax=Soboliphyme baturini TaxID=241478 RepID=A0A183IU21_9BILA|nr:unnamed protein product [Soboliphyme baturini]
MSRGIFLPPVVSTQVAASDSADEWETDPDFVNDVGEQEGRWGSKTVEGSGHQKGDRELKRIQFEQMPKPSEGYGGKFGIQQDRVDKSAESWDYKGVTQKHPSQKDYSVGFGGQFGVQRDHQDKSAVGWDYKEKVAVHESQKGIR